MKLTQNLTIFGANLRDQSKGQFVVHAAGCADCKKLARETRDDFTAASLLEVSEYIWSDIIAEGSMTAMDGLQEIHFAPCVTLPMAAFAEATAPAPGIPTAPEPVTASDTTNIKDYGLPELHAILPTDRHAVRDEAQRRHAALVKKVRRAKAKHDELELELLRIEALIDKARS